MTEPFLRVGRIVHYVSLGSADGTYPSVCRAADVTEADASRERAGLCVKNPEGLHFRSLAMGGVAQDPHGSRGTWHWPMECPHGQ